MLRDWISASEPASAAIPCPISHVRASGSSFNSASQKARLEALISCRNRSSLGLLKPISWRPEKTRWSAPLSTTKADGARFIATNPDATGPSAEGVLPATGSVAALITKATGREPYIVGKPNPMMFRSAMRKIGAYSESTGMIGDRMDTDVVAGIEAGLHTVLVLTGIADDAEIAKYPFRPTEILNSVADLI